MPRLGPLEKIGELETFADDKGDGCVENAEGSII